MNKVIHHIFYLMACACLCMCMGCAQVDSAGVDNLNDGKIQVIGHGGSGFISLINPFNPYPANSNTSISKALDENGADGIEVDIQVSKDSVIILYHDKLLDTKTAKKGCISEMNAKDIIGTEYQCGAPYDMFQSETIGSLEMLLQQLEGRSPYPFLYLDAHAGNACDSSNTNSAFPRFAIALVRLLHRYKVPAERVFFSSSSTDLLDLVTILKPRFTMIYEEVSDFEQGLSITKERGYESLLIKAKLLTTEQVGKAHEEGIEIITFGGKSRSGIADIIRLNPDVIQVNNIPTLKKLLER